MMGGIVQLALLLGGASAARRRLDDARCYDGAAWNIGGSPHKDCGYLSKKEHLCAKKDQATKTVGYEASLRVRPLRRRHGLDELVRHGEAEERLRLDRQENGQEAQARVQEHQGLDGR